MVFVETERGVLRPHGMGYGRCKDREGIGEKHQPSEVARGYTRAVEDRLYALEEKISYCDRDLAELNDTVYRQQLTIDKLQQQVRLITEQLRSLGINVDPEPHQKPPHY